MNELTRILSKKPEDRTEEELKFLTDNAAEMSEEQKKQLEDETAPIEVIEISPLSSEVGKTVTRQFAVEVKDLGEGVLEAVVASEALDRHGETIDIKGMNIKKYMENPVVAWGHDYSEPAIAKTQKLTKTHDGKLIAKMEFATKIYDKAKLVYDLYKGGFMKAFSIGFIPEEVVGNRYTKAEMIEFSAVLVPANPEALLLAKKRGIDTDLLSCNNSRSMNELQRILAKAKEDLTLKEVAYLKEHSAELSEDQKKTYSDLLVEKKSETPDVAKAVADAVAPLAKKVEELEAADKAVIKDIKGQFDPRFNIAEGEATKEIKFLAYVRGLMTGNFRDYMNVVGKDAMTTSNTGDVLPPAEFLAEVERLEAQYGVARRFATLRTSTNGNGITYLQGDDDLEIFETSEAGAKKSTKLSYAPLSLAWRKFAGILPITDELLEDSAVDLFVDASNRFARKYSQKEDQLVFTEAGTGGNKKKGVLEVSGTNAVELEGDYTDSFENVNYDALSKAIWGVPTASEMGGQFYLHREILGVIQRLKDNEGRPLWQRAMADGTPATILGKPYQLVEVMPKLSDDAEGQGFIIFGDLKYSTLAERTGLNIIIRDTGTVGDPDEEDQETNTMNLFTQDMKAMRAVKRFNAVCRFPTAFSVIKTSGSHS